MSGRAALIGAALSRGRLEERMVAQAIDFHQRRDRFRDQLARCTNSSHNQHADARYHTAVPCCGAGSGDARRSSTRHCRSCEASTQRCYTCVRRRSRLWCPVALARVQQLTPCRSSAGDRVRRSPLSMRPPSRARAGATRSRPTATSAMRASRRRRGALAATRALVELPSESRQKALAQVAARSHPAQRQESRPPAPTCRPPAPTFSPAAARPAALRGSRQCQVPA